MVSTQRSIKGGQIMLTYCYAWTPLVIVTTVAVLSIPWLGLIALIVLLLAVIAALGALLAGIASGAHLLGQATAHRSQERYVTTVRTPTTASPVDASLSATSPAAVGATLLLGSPTPKAALCDESVDTLVPPAIRYQARRRGA
jgi:hypothetical protein